MPALVTQTQRALVYANRTVNATLSYDVADLVYNNEIIDHAGAYNPSTGVFTAPDDGYYSLSLNGVFTLYATAGNGTNWAVLCLKKNGAAVEGGICGQVMNNNSLTFYLCGTCIMRLVRGDTLNPYIYTYSSYPSGAYVTFYGGAGTDYHNHLCIERLRINDGTNV